MRRVVVHVAYKDKLSILPCEKKIQTKSLKDCMEENAEYYGIMLQAEEESLAAKEEAAEKMAAEGEAAAEGDRPKEED